MRRRRRGIKKRSTHEPACNILPRGHKNHLGCVHGILFYSATQRLYIREQTEWGSLARRTTTPREPQVHVLFGSMYVLFFSRSSLSDVFLKGIRRAGQGHSTGCLCHAPVSKKTPHRLTLRVCKGLHDFFYPRRFPPSYLSTLIRFPARVYPHGSLQISCCHSYLLNSRIVDAKGPKHVYCVQDFRTGP